MLLPAIYFLVAFLLSWLPESARKHRKLQQFNSVPIHVLSGIAEILAAFATLAFLFFRDMNSFTNSIAATFAHQNVGGITEADLRGIGPLGFIVFLLQPASLFYCALMTEGMLRSLSALLTGRTPGTFLLAIPFRLALLGRRRWQAHVHLKALGPVRPDEILSPETTLTGLLEIHASREKRWHDKQVLEHETRFYILTSRQLIPRGVHHCFCYRFRPMHPGEIIRGSIAVRGLEQGKPGEPTLDFRIKQ